MTVHVAESHQSPTIVYSSETNTEPQREQEQAVSSAMLGERTVATVIDFPQDRLLESIQESKKACETRFAILEKQKSNANKELAEHQLQLREKTEIAAMHFDCGVGDVRYVAAKKEQDYFCEVSAQLHAIDHEIAELRRKYDELDADQIRIEEAIEARHYESYTIDKLT